MPIIFAQALMFIPLAIVQYNSDNASWLVQNLLNNRSVLYNVIYVFLIIAFTYFYTAITLNPTQMAEDMKRNNGFIPGVKPGKETAEYIETIMSRITFPGSLFIAFIAVMPALARKRSKRCPASLGPMVNSFIRFFLYSHQSDG